jgi:hypothetical protein
MDYKIVFTDELISSTSGLFIVGNLLKKTNLKNRINKQFKNNLISNSDIMFSYIGLLCQGKNDFDNIEAYRKEPFFKKALRIDKVPSSPTLRQRFDHIGNDLRDTLLSENVLLIKNTNSVITPCIDDYVPLDIDVSPFDNSGSSKEGVSKTYKEFDGYAPIFAYLGEEGYCINTELREGKTHCQYGTDVFLKETITYAKMITAKPLLVRLDSGNDSINNIKVCLSTETKSDYIIKRNIRKESKENWLTIAEDNAEKAESTLERDVFIGSTYIRREEVDQPLRVVFKISRIKSRKGQLLLIPEIEIETYWTSLDYSPKKIIELYHLHGKSEQFHSEIKTDLDIERLPSGKFETNSLVLHLGITAYNILRIIGQESLKNDDTPLRKHVERRRIKTVIQNIIYFATKLVSHARTTFLKASKTNMWFETFKRLNIALF